MSIRQSILYSQNFLKDSSLIALLLEESSISSHDTVYEIGPGKGIITEQLALRCKQVIAIEKDPYLSSLLRQKFAGMSNVTIHQGDFLHYHLPHQPYKVFANIPFNITTAIVTKLTTWEHSSQDAYLVMQREAAEMFLGRPHETLRTILLKPWFEMEVVHHFARKDFIPAPRVDVVMLRLRKRGPPLIQHTERQCFRDFVTYIFTAWKPTLQTTLNSIFTRQQLKAMRRAGLGVNLNGTPTSLSFEQWLTLFEYFEVVKNKQVMHVISGSEQRLMQQQNELQKRRQTRTTK